jgi:hypothetical protein
VSRQQQHPAYPPNDVSPANLTELHPHHLKNIMSRLLSDDAGCGSRLERLP